MDEKISSPVTDSGGFSTSGIVNSLTGLLSKAADTAIDVWGLKQEYKYTQPEAGKNGLIGSVYPTGQKDPASVPEEMRTGANGVDTAALMKSVQMGLIAVFAIGAVYWAASTVRRRKGR